MYRIVAAVSIFRAVVGPPARHDDAPFLEAFGVLVEAAVIFVRAFIISGAGNFDTLIIVGALRVCGFLRGR